MGKKIYVLDTSALLHYPDLMFRLENCEVVIPRAAVGELQGLKHNVNRLIAEAAETVLNTLHLYGSRILDGVELPSGAILRIYNDFRPIDDLASEADNKIVGVAIAMKKDTGAEVAVLSTDTNMRNVARAYGLTANVPCFSEDAGLKTVS
ncbi:MAG: PIN domain-containing protein [Nitrospiraceae bacterium]|nr:PIN domain-containing protein [Nitrospiraceae bacterium]MDA8090114.1 PIN domain-containing protein [Nitrospiraceae bacterium]